MSEPEKIYGCPNVIKQLTHNSQGYCSLNPDNKLADVVQFKALPKVPQLVVNQFIKAAELYLVENDYILPSGEHLDKDWFINDWCSVYQLFIWRGRGHYAQEFVDNIMDTAQAVHEAFYDAENDIN